MAKISKENTANEEHCAYKKIKWENLILNKTCEKLTSYDRSNNTIENILSDDPSGQTLILKSLHINPMDNKR